MTDKGWREEIVQAIQEAELRDFAEEHQLQALFHPRRGAMPEDNSSRLSADNRPR
ncbi:Uncharacterised protein [Serratia entomophila]|jgi:hypothetical protein|uniref:Uncharacterized protein n=1 Tax=Serratia entomophila TaxID=42906 RepID=A0ABY5CS63_9GAMM|nr:hypothetical protein [Serratia entomophila]UIW18219.1 hypothetical protein KHA73_22970 [Serratia entomophila]USV01004.1 hypothetical protein KFQ06_00075 [Serratia entomophila]CAI0974655.1 Uncharacterised protein [Serratia entomophila]CAI0987434.1 Uncharacterised protein [Serratia entomophila]CAI0988482.1 Uncharacterised protein [Serratia entomophila]